MALTGVRVLHVPPRSVESVLYSWESWGDKYRKRKNGSKETSDKETVTFKDCGKSPPLW